MRVFLTGASGYIGRHVALELLSRGHQVTGLARRPSDRTNYSTDLDWQYAQLSEFDVYRDTLISSDAVVHCAMDYTSAGVENSELDLEFVSRMSTFEGRFIYTGNLFSNREHRFLTEEVVTGGGHWRFDSEASALEASDNASVIRLGFVYGSDGGYLWDILSPDTLRNLAGESVPEVLWPMIHVADAACLFADVLESRASGVFHAFDGTAVNAREVIEATRSVYQLKGVSGSESHDYINGLLKCSVETSNRRSLSIGWHPRYENFVDNEPPREYRRLIYVSAESRV